jgi:adenine phosphoribosyltransferase
MKTHTFTLRVAGLERVLPKIEINENLTIASFVILGDTQLIEKCSSIMAKKIPEVDYIICPEAKSIPLAHSISVHKGVDYVVLRKSIKGYMNNPIIEEVKSITTIEKQQLVIDGKDAEKLKGKRVAIIDDVVSTGGSLETVEKLMGKINSIIVWRGAILLEGDKEFDDLFYLERLPLWYK